MERAFVERALLRRARITPGAGGGCRRALGDGANAWRSTAHGRGVGTGGGAGGIGLSWARRNGAEPRSGRAGTEAIV